MGIALTKNSIDLGINTNNGPAMLAFYRDLLGLKYMGEMAMPGGGVMHRMMCGDSMIKLRIMPDTPPLHPAAPGGIQSGRFALLDHDHQQPDRDGQGLRRCGHACGGARARVSARGAHCHRDRPGWELGGVFSAGLTRQRLPQCGRVSACFLRSAMVIRCSKRLWPS